MRGVILAGLVLFAAFAAFVAVMAWSQADIIFPTHAVSPPGPMPNGTERLELETPDGHRLHGVHIPPASGEPAERLLVLGFAGNAWNSADAAAYLHDIYPEAHVVAFHYRGYAPSTGSPSAEALRADAPLVLAEAQRRVKPKRSVLVGFSIGSGVAASLAAHKDVDGLILVTPFDSLKAVAQGYYPWLPVGLLFSEEMDAAGPLETSATPVAIIAAERDTLIPPRRTDALRGRVRNLVFDRTIPGAGHNDLYQRPDFHQAMREALGKLTSR